MITVIDVTDIRVKASALGILFNIFNVGQANVPITTINISHTSAANGIIVIREVAKTISNIKNIDADIPETLPLPPLEILIIDCQIIAHPHIEEKKPQTTFAIHCPIDSLFHFPLVPVNSSIRESVIRDSVRPIIANINEYGRIIYNISKNETSILGI